MLSSDFRDLVLRAQNGDDEALQDVFNRVRPFVERTARELDDPGRASRSVSDLVQETEVRAWRGIESFLGGADDSEAFHRFRKWMERILRNVANNIHRERNSEKRRAPGYRVQRLDAGSDSELGFEPSGDSSTASQRVVKEEAQDEVRIAIENLPDETDRAVVRAYFFDTPNLTEIARRLDLTYRVALHPDGQTRP
ncbi:MAG: sigma-70 family RNA polymerase sigma factor [Planctomycetota bacterium]